VRDRTARLARWSASGVIAASSVGAVAYSWVDQGADSLLDALLAVALIGAFAGVGLTVSARQSSNPIGWLFVGAATGVALGGFLDTYSKHVIEPLLAPLRSGGLTGAEQAQLLSRLEALPGATGAAVAAGWVAGTGIFSLLVFGLLLFPDGRLPSQRWRVLVWVTVAGMVGVAVSAVLAPRTYSDALKIDLPNPTGIGGLGPAMDAVAGAGFFLLLGAAVAAAASMVVRYRQTQGEVRQQVKWFVYGGVFVILAVVADAILEFWLDIPLGGLLFLVGLLGLATTTGVAILRHRLWEIDVVINKTIMVGLLVAFVTVVYVAVVVGIGAVVAGRGEGSRASTFLAVVASVVIAVAFQPARARAQRLANLLVYGRRATPYEVLSGFSRMGGTYAADDLLPRMARALGEGTGAARARVWLRVGNELLAEGTWPPAADLLRLPLVDGQMPPIEDADAAYPVRYEGELLGALSVTKPRGEPLTPTEGKLVADLASQAGLVLRNARLIEELRASRQRLVSAQDQERRRLERNIHDGAQQQLVALAVKLRLADGLLDRDPARAHQLMAQLQSEAGSALEDLRDLARGIYPPLLADRGLATALEAQARKSAVPVVVEADGIGRYAPETEAAVYFCTLEALQNAAKYAEATLVKVRLREVDGELSFEVEDDGVGFDQSAAGRGSGLLGMADRLDVVGGRLDVRSRPGRGTVIGGRVPAAAAPGSH
jgi:signal transduction histidine kinase